MKKETSYKDYLIRGESFQREKNGTWVPQYTLTRRDAATKKIDFPSHQYQFNHTCPTEREAEEFAVQMAQEWIDKNCSQNPGSVPLVQD
jgi:hypothetical protein